MKKRNFKKPLSLVLSGIMAISLGGVANLKINAEAASDPSINKFATADQLLDESIFNLREVGKTKNVYGGKGTKAQKVYFGKDKIGQSQKWYIAGSENDILVLFTDPAQPLLTGQEFHSNNSMRNCDTGDGACIYVNTSSLQQEESPSRVYSNHYSSSDLRTAIKGLLTTTKRFSEKEQGMMVSTRIYTEDTNNNRVYYNEDKLYPAYAYNTRENTIYVGENQADKLASGISINLNALTGSNGFWLRTPMSSPWFKESALVASPGTLVNYRYVDGTSQCGVSASIDLTSLIFASTAPAASSSSSFSNENAMTFRYQDTEEKIKSKAIWGSKGVVVKKSAEDVENVYLYIQGKNGNQDWVYSTQITKNTVLLLQYIGHEDADLSQCKIWLETFDKNDNMVYAKFAEEDSKEQINLGISDSIDLNGDSVDNNASDSGFVTSSVDPMAISQPMVSKSLKESVKFGQNIAKTDSGETIQVDVSNIENSALTTEQKDMFKDKDAICLDFTSSGKYDKVETINYSLGKDLINQEFKVYYIYEGKIQLLVENLKVDNEGNIKITADHGATYILVTR